MQLNKFEILDCGSKMVAVYLFIYFFTSLSFCNDAKTEISSLFSFLFLLRYKNLNELPIQTYSPH